MRKFIFGLSLATVFLTGCDLLEEVVESLQLTEEEVVEGLKTALEVGTDSAATTLSVTDGYYQGSPLLAIIQLPEEVEAVRNTINNNSSVATVSETIGLDGKFDEVILNINRAAEDAAQEAAPIFLEAITNLSLADAWDILNGEVPASTKSTASFDSTAATTYFKNETYAALVELYAPKINSSLDKDLVGNTSANDVWASTTSTYNDFLSNSVVSLAVTFSGLNIPGSLDTDLGAYCTEKALDELFDRVAEIEISIRRDPYQWSLDILQRVFGDSL